MSGLNVNIETNLTRVLRESDLGEADIDEEFLKYYFQLISLNPQYGKQIGRSSTAEDFKGVVEICIEAISDENDPTILTLKMQNYYLKNYDTFDNLIKKNQNKINVCTEVLLKDIINSNPRNKEERDKLLRRISIYLVLKSGLGNPGSIQVLREGTAALHSIFTKEDLRDFTDLSNSQKERQLHQILGYVSGIRIFNKDCGKGGDSIPELATRLPDAIEATSLALSHCLIRIMERVNLLTTSIDAYITVHHVTKNVEVKVPDENKVTTDDYRRICKILTLYRQYEVFVRKLISDMDRVRVDNKELVLNFAVHLYDLHSLVRYRTAVPADQVFPYFYALWVHWQQMQNDMFIVSTINDIMWNLDSWHEKLDVPHETIDALLNGREIVSDAQRIQLTENFKIEQRMNKCQIFYQNEKKSYENSLQYLGFCTLCLCTGALIPANPKIGICLWAGNHYVFCSVDHAKIFGFSPDRYIKENLEYARNNVEMINFLQMYEDVYAVRNQTILFTKPAAAATVVEKHIQTELHPIPTFIDKDYKWNVWDQKRQAVQLANIAKCKTHSTQTKYSYGLLEFGCQTDNTRDKMSQTMANVSTSTPAIKNFIWGLRGQREDVQHVINLTAPIDEKCQSP